MKISKKILLAPLLVSLFFVQPAQAFCPVCTVAVGVGVGLSRWLGIDDTISGVWIGGMVVALIMWFSDWLEKKEIRFKFRTSIVTVAFYAMVVLPLFFTGIMGHPMNKLLNIDKLLWGIIVGSLAFFAATQTNDYIVKKNGGKVYFPFQKVSFSLAALLICSFIFFLIVY